MSGRCARVGTLCGLLVLATAAAAPAVPPPTETPAEPADPATVKLAVAANNAFGLALHRRLAEADAGGNLFFSPYSLMSALAMTAEGARGRTALEMGDVLGLPAALRQNGKEAAELPWRMAELHDGLATVNGQLNAAGPPAAEAIRARIETLRAELKTANHDAEAAIAKSQWDACRKAAQKAEGLAAELNGLLPQVDQYELRVANALWGEKTYPFRPEYVATIGKHYKTGGVFAADFLHNFPAERNRINGWVAAQTRDRIRDLIPELPPETARMLRLVLTNAIYFKGEWLEPFKESYTRPRPFTRADGGTVERPQMEAGHLEVARYAAFNADGSFFQTPRQIKAGQTTGLYPDADGFALLELPYKGGQITMVLLAPNRPDGLAAIERKLDAAAISAWTAKLVERPVHVFVPTFKLETKYDLGDTLQAMGMKRAFTNPLSADGADFSGMSASLDRAQQLYISQVVHKAFVEVNEKGTEAAAATAVMMSPGEEAPAEKTVPFTPTFKADRPFLFLIRHRPTGCILFLGRVTDPAGR